MLHATTKSAARRAKATRTSRNTLNSAAAIPAVGGSPLDYPRALEGFEGSPRIAARHRLKSASVDDYANELILDGPAALNQKDPNYDSASEEDENVALVELVLPPPTPPRAPSSLGQYKHEIKGKVIEFFVSEDVSNLAESIKDLDAPEYGYEAVRRLITTAMDHDARERELASRALAELRDARALDEEQCRKGFERLLELSNDLVLDVPAAKDQLAKFVARAVADDVLPPAFVTDPAVERLAPDVIHTARVLMSVRRATASLSRVWGLTNLAPSELEGSDEEDEVVVAAEEEEEAAAPKGVGSPLVPAKNLTTTLPALKHSIVVLLEEYFTSGDMDEAIDCVVRLKTPHFHHEIIRRAIKISLDGKQRQRAMAAALIAELHARNVVTSEQVALGFERIVRDLPDLELDTPGAKGIVAIFFDQALKDGVVKTVPALDG